MCKVLNAMMWPVIRADYPVNYPSMQAYLVEVLQGINRQVQQKEVQVLFSPETKRLLSTLKHVFLEQSKKRGMNTRSMYLANTLLV